MYSTYNLQCRFYIVIQAVVLPFIFGCIYFTLHEIVKIIILINRMEFARSPSDNVAFERVDQIKLLSDKKKEYI